MVCGNMKFISNVDRKLLDSNDKFIENTRQKETVPSCI